METIVGLLISWAILTIAILIVAKVVPGTEVKGVTGAILVALVFGVINWALGRFLWSRPPISGSGLGMLWQLAGYWVSNIILLWVTDKISKSLTIKSFKALAMSGLVMAILLVAAAYLRSKAGI